MKTNSVAKVARDMYIEQMKWSVWFICIIMAVYISLNIAGSYFNFKFTNSLLMFTSGSSMIYMLVIGIIAGSTFLTQYIKLGVTRKVCIYGMAVAALYISVTLPLIFNLFSAIESIFTGVFRFNFASFILYIFNIYFGYLLGWLINIGYYKFNWMIGLLFIAFAIFLNSMYAIIWRGNILSLFEVNINTIDVNFEAAVQYSSSYFLMGSIGTVLLIVITLLIIRLLTKNISVKIR